jgi:hypothetical protein
MKRLLTVALFVLLPLGALVRLLPEPEPLEIAAPGKPRKVRLRVVKYGPTVLVKRGFMSNVLIGATAIDSGGISDTTILHNSNTTSSEGSVTFSDTSFVTFDLGDEYVFTAAHAYLQGQGGSGDVIYVAGSNSSDMSGAVALCTMAADAGTGGNDGFDSNDTITDTAGYRYVRFLYYGGYYVGITEYELYGTLAGGGGGGSSSSASLLMKFKQQQAR